MEIAELYVINKSDRPGADKLKQEVEVMLGIRRGNAFAHVRPHHGRLEGEKVGRKNLPAVHHSNDWEAPVLTTVASKGEGIPGLIAALDQHHEYLERTGKLGERRTRRSAARPIPTSGTSFCSSTVRPASPSRSTFPP